MHLATKQTKKNVVAEFYMAISNEISTKGVISRTGIIHAYPLSSTGNYYHLGGYENVHICIFFDRSFLKILIFSTDNGRFSARPFIFENSYFFY